VQSRFFAEKARVALEQKNINEAMLSLSLAYQLDRRNYAAGFTLAQLWQIGQPALADQVYAQLARDHPEKRAATLTAWYQSLLMRTDFTAIRLLATDALKVDAAHADAWLHALIFSLRREPDAVAQQKLVDDPGLNEDARALFALDLRTQEKASEAGRRVLLSAPTDLTYSYYHYYRAYRLIELGFPSDALGLLERHGSRLSSRDRLVLWLEACSAAGWTEGTRGEVARLLGTQPGAGIVELICAHLVRHPDRGLFMMLVDRLRAAPLSLTENHYSAYISLLCAAGAVGDLSELREATLKVKQLAGTRFEALDLVEAFFRSPGANARIEACLPALQPLPIEMTYALIERYYQRRSADQLRVGHLP
jgi:hypothetical protein